jgi:glycosyltransferase involved in cell wall biosynthesis
LSENRVVRWFLRNKIACLLKKSQMAFCGNNYLLDYASRYCTMARIVPTVLDTNAFAPSPTSVEGPNRCIGWIGTPSTWSAYMGPMMPLLTGVAAAHGARLMAVGAGKTAGPHPLLDNLPWSEETEVARIQDMDIGIMPLTDTPWARGKCGYKLIQYMACGLPVVASPVGVNADIVEHGVNGFLASTEEEWRTALGVLLSDPELRRRMGAEGRQKVERQYSLQVWGPKVASMLHDVTQRGRVA